MNRSTFNAMLAQYSKEERSGYGGVLWENGARCFIPEVVIGGKAEQSGTPTPENPIVPTFSEGTTVVSRGDDPAFDGGTATAPELLALSNEFETVPDTYDPQTGIVTRRVGMVKYTPLTKWFFDVNNDPEWVSIFTTKREMNNPDIPVDLYRSPLFCNICPYFFDESVNYKGRTRTMVTGYGDASCFVMHTFPKPLFPDLDSWLQFISNNEVIVWYPLAKPKYEQYAPQPLVQPRGNGSIIQTGGTLENCPIAVTPVTHQ